MSSAGILLKKHWTRLHKNFVSRTASRFSVADVLCLKNDFWAWAVQMGAVESNGKERRFKNFVGVSVRFLGSKGGMAGKRGGHCDDASSRIKAAG